MAVEATRPLPPGERLRHLAGDAPGISCWTRTCAPYEIGRTQRRELNDVVARHLAHPEALIKETAVWANGQLAEGAGG